MDEKLSGPWESCIEVLHGDDLLQPCIQNAAIFAVNNNNIKHQVMELVGVEKAARQTLSGHIFYLVLKIKYKGQNDIQLFETAVWHLFDCYLFDWVDLAVYNPQSAVVVDESDVVVDMPSAIMSAAKYAVHYHNEKNGTYLKLVDVNSYYQALRGDYIRYCLILLAKDVQGKHVFFETIVTKGEWHSKIESRGLVRLCEANTQTNKKKMSTTPDWVSLQLFSKVRKTCTCYADKLVSQMGNPIYLALTEKGLYWLQGFAQAIGVEETRKTMILKLSRDPLNTDISSEALFAMTESLPYLATLIGGFEYLHTLLPVLEGICIVEEPFIRDRAVLSLCYIGDCMSKANLLRWFVPLVKRLATGKLFTGRVSSCGLFHIVYPSAEENLKTDLRLFYSQLCKDCVVVVRKSAALNIGKFAATVDPSHLKTDVMSMFHGLEEDEENSVRLSAVEACTRLMERLEPQDSVVHILPAICKFAKDEFWLVRYMAAKQLDEVCKVAAAAPIGYDLLVAYRYLLHDENEDVRKIAAGKVTTISWILTPDHAQGYVFTWIKDLSVDSSHDVRCALASGMMGMAQVLGKDWTLLQLLPLLRSMLTDEDQDPVVQLTIISKLDLVNKIVQIDELCQPVLDTVNKLATNGDWRVRLAIIEHIPQLASQLDLKGCYDGGLGAHCKRELKNEVCFVRNAAAKSLAKLRPVKNSPSLQVVEQIPNMKEMIQRVDQRIYPYVEELD